MGGKCRSRQVRWVPGRDGRERMGLCLETVLHMYLLGERVRWPEGTVSLRSGSGIKSHSGVWVSDRRGPSPCSEARGTVPPGNTLAPAGAPPCQLSSSKEILWLSSHVHSLKGPSSCRGASHLHRWAAETQRAWFPAKVTIPDPDVILSFRPFCLH